MKIYAIGDLHLSKSSNKPMDIFGWIGHKEKIFEDWILKVTDEDLVIIAGDTSWAISLDEAKADLDEIEALPGKKIVIKGNHDYWWASLSKMNKLYESITFLHNTAYEFGDYVISGTRGWICPNETKFEEADQKIYEREAQRLKNSLEAALRFKDKEIIVALHYPPTNDKFENSMFTNLFKEYNVHKVVYGHLHGQEAFKLGLQGEMDSIEYHLVSCDFLDFSIKRIA